MVLCLLSRDSHGDTGKLNHEETVRGPEIAIFPEKSEILLLILVKILKKSDSTHSSSKGAVNAYFLTGSFSKKTWLFEAVVLVGPSKDGKEPGCEVSRRVKPAVFRGLRTAEPINEPCRTTGIDMTISFRKAEDKVRKS